RANKRPQQGQPRSQPGCSGCARMRFVIANLRTFDRLGPSLLRTRDFGNIASPRNRKPAMEGGQGSIPLFVVVIAEGGVRWPMVWVFAQRAQEPTPSLFLQAIAEENRSCFAAQG